MRNFYLNFDTKNLTTGKPFDCQLLCETPVQGNISKIYLRSCEIPIGWYNIRSPYNVFSIYQGTTFYSITITEGSYTIATLLTEIATALSTATVKTYSLTYNSITNKVIISNSNSQAFTIYTISFDLCQILGFTTGQTSSSASITSSNSYNLNFDTYVNLVIDNLPTSYLNTNLCSYKIPITEGYGSLLYLFNNSTFQQFIDCENSHIQIYNLKVRIIDRFGNTINNNGLNFSFLLEFMFSD